MSKPKTFLTLISCCLGGLVLQVPSANHVYGAENHPIELQAGSGETPNFSSIITDLNSLKGLHEKLVSAVGDANKAAALTPEVVLPQIDDMIRVIGDLQTDISDDGAVTISLRRLIDAANRNKGRINSTSNYTQQAKDNMMAEWTHTIDEANKGLDTMITLRKDATSLRESVREMRYILTEMTIATQSHEAAKKINDALDTIKTTISSIINKISAYKKMPIS